MASIAIRDITKNYGRNQVVHGVDLDIGSGEFVVILGPSGCGKSTLLRMIAGLEEISGGEIAIDGTVVNRLEPRERGCAMVFQNYALYPHMSVADNIGYALKVAGVPRAARAERVRAVARMLELEPLLDRRPARCPAASASGSPWPRDDPRAEGLPVRRAAFQPRRQAARADAFRDPQAAPPLAATSIFVTHDRSRR